jgi:pimeloyl-ACP methyl ester carboxylesterase
MSMPLCAMAAAQANVKSGFAPVANGKIYYEEAGSGPAVVLLHGGQLDLRMWDEQFALLAPHYHVVRYDARGFGKSPAATAPFANEEDLAQLLQYLKIDKATLVGLSLGGRIAIDFVLAHPEMTDKLFLAAPGLGGFRFSPDPNEQKIFEAAQQGDWQKSADAWLSSGYMKPAMENPAIAPKIRQLALDNAHEELDNFALVKELKPSAIARLNQIKARTLVVVGDRDVHDIDEIAGLVRIQVPDSELAVVKGSGHMINMEKPEEFNRLLVEFLK